MVEFYLNDSIQTLGLRTHYQIDLIWVPGNKGTEGNKKADECVINGFCLDETTSCKDVLTLQQDYRHMRNMKVTIVLEK